MLPQLGGLLLELCARKHAALFQENAQRLESHGEGCSSLYPHLELFGECVRLFVSHRRFFLPRRNCGSDFSARFRQFLAGQGGVGEALTEDSRAGFKEPSGVGVLAVVESIDLLIEVTKPSNSSRRSGDRACVMFRQGICGTWDRMKKLLAVLTNSRP
jgi:hypothetical protein